MSIDYPMMSSRFEGSSGPAIQQSNLVGKRKGRTMKSLTGSKNRGKS
jgi:hypothetical protein